MRAMLSTSLVLGAEEATPLGGTERGKADALWAFDAPDKKRPCVRAARVTGRWLRSLMALAFALLFATAAHAVDPSEILPDPRQEARARALSAELRCLVCQNQSIDDSNAPLAKDLRVLVREQIKAGKSDLEVMSYVVERYGDFVLLRPRLTWGTALLWSTPLLILASVGYALVVRRRQALVSEAPPLTPEEQRRLDALLKSKDLA